MEAGTLASFVIPWAVTSTVLFHFQLTDHFVEQVVVYPINVHAVQVLLNVLGAKEGVATSGNHQVGSNIV